MPEEPAGSSHPTDPTEPADGGTRLRIGDKVGRYELLAVLGEGGMSYVYLAHDPELDRDVALKLMRVRVGTEGARRLRREAQALAQLSHPNVVPVYDAGMVGGQAFVAMEYVQGRTLRKWLRGRPGWREIIDVMIAAGQGLAAAHARGLIHRDFKPDNVLLGDDGRVRVLDFGLARLAGVLEGSIMPSNPSDSIPPPPPSSGGALASVEALITRADQLIGTPAYMAPEQIRRDLVDARSDVFAFGVTLYEGLFGTRPFDPPVPRTVGSHAATVSTTFTDLGLREPRPPPRKTPVPRHVQRIVLRAVAFDPAARWQSVEAMLEALRRDPWRPWRRAGVAAAAVAAAGAIALGASRTRPDTRALCHGGATRVEAVWASGARDAVRAAFAATKLPYANDAMESVSRAIEQYTGHLADRSDDACAATRLRGEQSEDALELRMSCYEDHWREVGALIDVLRKADAVTVKEAAHAARSLSAIDDCTDVAALRAPTPKPREPGAAAQVVSLEQRLAALMATYSIGRASDAATAGDALVADARRVGFLPIVAKADLWRGRAFADLADEDRSVPAFRAAFSEALATREDAVLREAAIRLAQEYIYAHQPAEFDYWADVAQAAIDRGAADPHLQSFLDHARCVALYNTGKMVERLTCLERHAGQVEPGRPLDEWELTTLGLAAVDVGQFDRGLDYVRRGYRFAVSTYGATHPRTLEMRMYECKAQVDAGDFAGATTTCGEALQTMQQEATDNAALIARDRLYTALALVGSKHYEGARAELGRAKDMGADESEVLEATAMLDAATGHPDRAVPHYRQAVADELKELPPSHPDVIGAQLELGRVLLDQGKVPEARRVLDDALAKARSAQLAPTMRAKVEFADARAIARSDPGAPAQAQALDLARNALGAYVETPTHTAGLTEAREEIEAWIAKMSGG